MSLGALAFLNPWLLGALATLPIIYWLLRTVPPRPRQVTFPPTRILVGLENQEKTPAKSPWWLTLIRLLAATFIILALAEPVLNPSREAALDGKGPVAILVDNGWASAAHWSERERMIDRVIAEAESHNRPVVVVPTASAAKAVTARIEAPAEARSTAAALEPQPFAPDRLAAVKALETALEGAPKGSPSIVWLSDGIDHDGKAAETAQRLKTLAEDGTFAVVAGGRGGEALGVFAGIGQSGKLDARVMRAGTTAPSGFVHAYSVRGQRLGETPFTLGAAEPSATVSLELPLELRNQVARVEIAGEHSAGAVSLLDARSQWHRVALISGESREQAQPLLAPLYYIEKALAPFSELVKPKGSNLVAGIHDALAQNATVLVLADIGTLSGEAKKKVEDWVKRGGILVRFAGPRLENGGDELLPVPLRVGGRTLGGALSWSTPQPLGPIEDTSLFAGLPVPQEVTVNRQVLADPAMLGRDVDVWARLQDGTPLVTARKLGQGQIILFHVTANSDWSNLPLSGLFVEMLRRISALGGGVADEGEASAGDASGTQAPETPAVLAPLQTLDGYGILKSPPPTAQPVSAAKVHEIAPSLDHPPGYYGTESSPRAINVLAANSKLAPLPALPAGVQRLSYESEGAKPLKSWLLLASTRASVRRHHRHHPPAVGLRPCPAHAACARGRRDCRRAGIRAFRAAHIDAGQRAGDIRQRQQRRSRATEDAGIADRPARHGFNEQGHARLRAHRQHRDRRGEPPGPRRPRAPARRAHRGRAGPAGRRQHPHRRSRVLPRALLAGAARRRTAARADARQDRRLHEAGRSHRVRYAGLRPRAADGRPARPGRDPRCSASSAASTFRGSSRCRRTTCSRKPSTCCATSPAAGTAASSGSRRKMTPPARIMRCAAPASPTASPRSS